MRDKLIAPAKLFGPILFALTLATRAPAADPPATEVTFVAKIDGHEERYLQMLPAGFDPKQPHDLLLALHGHGSDRRQFVEDPRTECRAARDTAAKHGAIFISPDYRAKTSWMGPKAEADVVQIIEELKRRYKIRHVIVSGGSMGGTASLTFAALHPELVDGVVAMNGTANLWEYENFQDAIRASFGGDKQTVPAEYKRRSAEYAVEKLTMPIACTTGGRDTAVPPASVLRLVAALEKLGRPVRLIHRPEGGHSTNYADATEAYEFVFSKLAKQTR
jgi:dipeptidyl aminopeptidase/acylaminoacyl peptidase